MQTAQDSRHKMGKDWWGVGNVGAVFFASHFVVFDQSEEPKIVYAAFGDS